MSRLHDMGGRFGYGQVIPEPSDGPVFAEEWHARALAMGREVCARARARVPQWGRAICNEVLCVCVCEIGRAHV